MDERVIEAAIGRALEKLCERTEGVADRRARIERDLAEITTREQNLAAAIARGGDTLDALLTALKSEQRRRKLLEGQRAELDGAERLAGIARTELREQIRVILSNVRELLGAMTAQARQALRRLGVRFTVEPATLTDGRRGVRFVGHGSYRRLVSQIRPLGDAEVSVKRRKCPPPKAGPPHV
jgi:hypothetical protein